MDRRAGSVSEISLSSAEISVSEMKIFPYKHFHPAYRADFMLSARAQYFFCIKYDHIWPYIKYIQYG